MKKTEPSLENLITSLIYKGNNCGRKVKVIKSSETTLSFSRPSGLQGKKWECSTCGNSYNSDIKAAENIFRTCEK